MNSASAPLLLAYFGDDFTGSTDALEFLSRAGVRTALFLEPPSPAKLAALPELQAIGVAGLTRSLDSVQMEIVLEPAFAALRALGPRHVHYKVCSTFDSSPSVGSIGRAMEVGRRIFGAAPVPLLVGAPALGRYCAFGNLFARLGIGSAGEIYRLDRHPAMSRHPVTPAGESDLRLHLAQQTKLRCGLFDLLKLELPATEAAAALDRIIEGGADVVLFDVMYSAQLARIGALIDRGERTGPRFCVGSSGIEMALGAHWTQEGQLQAAPEWTPAGAVDRLLVVSGSCSPVTSGQIDWALAHGFVGVPLDPHEPRIEPTIADVAQVLATGRNAIVYTSRGTTQGRAAPAKLLGRALGEIALGAVERAGLCRVLVAGGDTSSYAARALGIEAVEMLAPLAPGAPLCRAHAPGRASDGLEINFKGGQVGAPDYFAAVQRGAL